MDPTNKPMKIKLLNGREHILLFDMNTFYEFEEKSGKTLPSFLMDMEKAIAPLIHKVKSKKTKDVVAALSDNDVLSALAPLSVKDLRALLWASLHDYDKEGEPVWPYTIGKLGSLIDHTNMFNIVGDMITGIRPSLPDPKSEKDKKERPTLDPLLPANNGGSESGSSDADILDSLPKKSAA